MLSQYCKHGSICESRQCDTPHNRVKDQERRDHLDAEEACDKIQLPFMIKTVSKLNRKELPPIIKAINEKPTANVILSGERLEAFPLR